MLGNHNKFVLPETKEKFNELTHKINLSDLDFNKHVNNKSYINLAEMTIPDEFKKNHTIKQLRVSFNKETFLDDVLNCTTYKTDTENMYVHKIEKDDISVCDVSTLWEEITDTSTIVDYPLKIKR